MSKRRSDFKPAPAAKRDPAPPCPAPSAQPLTEPDQLRQLAVECWQRGEDQAAAKAMAILLGTQETADGWVTWARIQDSFLRPVEAETGLRRALELDPLHVESAARLGILLARERRPEEALRYLESSLAQVDDSLRGVVAAAAEQCRNVLEQKPKECEIRSALESSMPQDEDVYRRSRSLERYTALLAMLPRVQGGERLLVVGDAAAILAPVVRNVFGFAVYTLPAGAETVNLPDGPHNQIRPSPTAQDLPGSRPWPFPDGFFDAALCCEFLERMHSSPMRELSELNRVVAAKGSWFLSAPNPVSNKSLESILFGENPSIQAKFTQGADGVETAGREYSPIEIESLARSAGFSIQQFRSQDFYWASRPQFLAKLAAGNFGIGLRGDTLLLQASKSGPVHDRYPARLYGFPKTANEPGSRPLRILVVHESVPSPSHSGADKRLWQVLRALRQLGHSVTLVGLREAVRWRARAEVEALGIEVRATDSDALRFEWNGYHAGYALDQVLGDGQFDVTLMTLWFWKMVSVPELYMDEIRRLSPRTRIAILTDDCHWLRQLRSAEVSGRWSDRERSFSMLQRENEVYSRADHVMSISQADMRNLEQQFPGIPVGYLPMSSDPGQPGPGFDARDGLVYMADYQNLASLDAIEWFMSDIWPRILSRLPNVKLHLIGSGMPEGLGQGARNVVRVGYVPDLGQEFAKYRVFVSPVRWGTGIKTKNLNALSHGLPLVTTTVGGEGMDLRHGESALVADTVQEFASAVIRAYEDKAVWKQLSEGGCAHVAATFSEQNMRARLAESLQQILRQKPRPYEPGHVWSFRLIDRHYPSLLSKPEAGREHQVRIVAYSRLAERLLATGERAEARRQLSHIFSIMSYPAAVDDLYERFGPAVDRMDRVYRGLGEPEAAAAMRAEANARFDPPAMAPPPSSESLRAKIRSASKPVFSVVIPTCNRRATLSDCLSALNRQHLSADQFEVIVVDDGSTDGTEDLCANVKTPFPLHYLRQENAGTGAARRRGIEQAQGKYLLLMNDDTIAAPDLLARHRAVHRQERESKVAVLGNFEYPPSARARALTYYLSVRPFLFPMMNMKAGRYSDPTFFVTCNLSAPRKAVLEAGSFDPDLRVGEDTDLGIRMVQRGFQIIYEPKAQAIHQHLDFKADDLVRRARAYAPAQFKLIHKHPWMLGDGTSPYGRMDGAAARNLQTLVQKGRENVPSALQSIRQFDDIDFERFWAIPSGKKSMAEEIVDLFSVSVPEVYFFYFYQAFLEVWMADGSFPAAGVEDELLAPAVVG